MKRININYKPLDKSVNLRVINGSLMQQYNATAQEYVPDYTLVPLVIQPDVYVTDPDNIITSGLKNSVLTDIIWYENEVISSKQISSSNTSYMIDTSATDTRGRISVKKNIPEGQQLTLIITAKFVDTRTGQAVPVNGSVLLCVAQAVETATPRILSSYPVGSRLYPTTGQRGLKIDCRLMAGDTELSPVWKWQIYEGSAYRDLTSTDQVQGLDTSRLWVPAGLMSRQTKIKTIATLSGKTYTQEHIIGITYERYDVDIIVPGNGEVVPDMTSVTVKAKVWNNRGVIDRPATYFKLEWLDQNNVKLGEGETLEIAKTKYASSDFGVNLKVSELYSGLVLGEKIWVADFRNNIDALITIGGLSLVTSFKFGSNKSCEISFIHDGQEGGAYFIEHVSEEETIFFTIRMYKETFDVVIIRQTPGLSYAVYIEDRPIKSGCNTLNFACLASGVFGFYGLINEERFDVPEVDFYEADILPYSAVKAFKISGKDSILDSSDKGVLLKKFKAGLLTMKFETGSIDVSGVANLTTTVSGAQESDLVKQIAI